MKRAGMSSKMNSTVIIGLILATATLPAMGENTMNSDTNILNFSQDHPHQWYAVNDGVMGGLSSSAMKVTGNGTGEFSGILSLENNGGFASVRTALPFVNFSSFSGVEFQVKGDDRQYQLRFRTDNRFDGVSYRAAFTAPAGQWTTVHLAFEDFEPVFRGRIQNNYPPLDTEALQQLIFMLADKNPGPFKLEICSFMVVKNKSAR